MSNQLTVNVTRRDIIYARATGVACPIAFAIAREQEVWLGDIKVGRGTIKVKDEHFVVPPVAQSFIAAYDTQRPVRPFQFVAEEALLLRSV